MLFFNGLVMTRDVLILALIFFRLIIILLIVFKLPNEVFLKFFIKMVVGMINDILKGG